MQNPEAGEEGPVNVYMYFLCLYMVISGPFAWQLLTRQKIENIGMDMEKWEASHTACGDMELCGRFSKRHS